jgi:hypothetical protein
MSRVEKRWVVQYETGVCCRAAPGDWLACTTPIGISLTSAEAMLPIIALIALSSAAIILSSLHPSQCTCKAASVHVCQLFVVPHWRHSSHILLQFQWQNKQRRLHHPRPSAESTLTSIHSKPSRAATRVILASLYQARLDGLSCLLAVGILDKLFHRWLPNKVRFVTDLVVLPVLRVMFARGWCTVCLVDAWSQSRDVVTWM